MVKRELKKQVMNKASLSEILGKPVTSFDLEEVKKGARLRADLYRCKVCYEGGEEKIRFAKDFWYSPNISGDIVKPLNENREVLGRNELKFLQFGTRERAFTPKYFGHKEYDNDKSGKHIVIFMENFDMSLEEKLLVIGEQMKGADEDEKKRLEDLAFDYVRRAIDINLVNNYLASRPGNQGYQTSDSIESPTVYRLDEGMLRRDVIRYLNGLMTFKLDQKAALEKKSLEVIVGDLNSWDRTYNYPDIIDLLMEYVVKPLGCDVDNRGLVNLEFIPGNVLLKKGELGEYESKDILKVRNGKNATNQYDGFAITDNSMISFGSYAFNASLLNHASVFSILPENRLRELAEHILIQQERLVQGKPIHLEDLPKERGTFDEECAAVNRYICLRNINFMSWLKLKYPKKAEELENLLPIYNPVGFINRHIDHFIGLKDDSAKYLGKVNDGLEAFKPEMF